MTKEKTQIINMISSFAYSIDGHLEAHRANVEQALPEGSVLKGLSLSEIHTIDYIGKNQKNNTTTLAQKLYLTKGAVSKIAAKLLKKGLIAANKAPDNKKEIRYSLTASGAEVFEVHKKLHKQEVKKLEELLNTYSKDEISAINDFLGKFIRLFEP